MARGRLRLLQPRPGYRFAIDSLLLADFAAGGGGSPTARRPTRVADLGTGAGVIALWLLAGDAELRAVGVEIQPPLAALARRNAALNGVADRFTVVEGDLVAVPLAAGSFDLVVSNPPYRRSGTGRPCPDRQAAVARHEMACTLPALVATAARIVRPGGRVAIVHQAGRLGDLLAALAARGLGPTRVRPVHPRPDRPARRVLVEARRGFAGDLAILPPLALLDAAGRPTAEVAAIVGDPPG